MLMSNNNNENIANIELLPKKNVGSARLLLSTVEPAFDVLFEPYRSNKNRGESSIMVG